MFKVKSINEFRLVNIHIFPSQHSGTERETVSVQNKLSVLSPYEKFFGSKKTPHCLFLGALGSRPYICLSSTSVSPK